MDAHASPTSLATANCVFETLRGGVVRCCGAPYSKCDRQLYLIVIGMVLWPPLSQNDQAVRCARLGPGCRCKQTINLDTERIVCRHAFFSLIPFGRRIS